MRTLGVLVVLVLSLCACADPDVGTFTGPSTISVTDPAGAMSPPQSGSSSVVITAAAGGSYLVLLQGTTPCPMTATRDSGGFVIASGQSCTFGSTSALSEVSSGVVTGNVLDITFLFRVFDTSGAFVGIASIHVQGTRQQS